MKVSLGLIKYPQDHVGAYPHWDGVAALSRIEFEFMGFAEAEILGVSLRGDETRREQKLKEVRARLSQIAGRWYATAPQ